MNKMDHCETLFRTVQLVCNDRSIENFVLFSFNNRHLRRAQSICIMDERDNNLN